MFGIAITLAFLPSKSKRRIWDGPPNKSATYKRVRGRLHELNHRIAWLERSSSRWPARDCPAASAKSFHAARRRGKADKAHYRVPIRAALIWSLNWVSCFQLPVRAEQVMGEIAAIAVGDRCQNKFSVV